MGSDDGYIILPETRMYANAVKTIDKSKGDAIHGYKCYPNLTFMTKQGWIKHGYYMNHNLYHNMADVFIPSVARDWDAWALITGGEGSGKSTFTFCLAHFCDPTFWGDAALDRICFSFKQFMHAIDNSSPGSAIVLDEAVITLMTQDAGTTLQKILIKKAVTMRKKRLFIFLVIPSIFLLRMYLAVNRTRFLVHTFSPDSVNRGFFRFYGPETKKKLYIFGRKTMDMTTVKPDFGGHFRDTTGFFFDSVAYERKKDKAILDLTESSPEAKDKTKDLKIKILENQRNIFLKEMVVAMQQGSGTKLTYKSIAEKLPDTTGIKISPNTLSAWVRKARQIDISKPENVNLIQL